MQQNNQLRKKEVIPLTDGLGLYQSHYQNLLIIRLKLKAKMYR